MKSVLIRTVTEADAPRLLEIYSYYVEKTAISFEYETPSLEEFRRRIRKTLERYPYLCVLADGVIAGYAYAGPFVGRAAYNRSSEMTIYLDPEARKYGFGRMLYEALEAALKEQGILNLYACIGYPEEDDEYLTKNSAQFHTMTRQMQFTDLDKISQIWLESNKEAHGLLGSDGSFWIL